MTTIKEETAMTAMTLDQARAATGTAFLGHLDAEASLPTVTTAACQGDVSILRVTTPDATTPIPSAGVVVATGQGGHDHTLHGGMFDRATRPGLTVGTLTVPEGVTCLLTHVEHGALIIAPGTYRIGGQREYAGQWREVAD